MHHHHGRLARHDADMVPRQLPRRPDNVPRERLSFLMGIEEPTLVKRAPSQSTTSASESCATGANCTKETSTMFTTTLPIVLGTLIPILCAIIVLIYFHRRNVKKLRKEDAMDKHKSLDFGLDLEPRGGSKAMRQAERAVHTKGMSLDIGPSPYLLPPGFRGSRDSLQSLSKSLSRDDDKYYHVNTMIVDNASIRSHPRSPLHDDSLSIAESTVKVDDMNEGLLRNAQRMSRSSPPFYNDHNRQSPGEKEQDMGLQLNLPRSMSPAHVPKVTENRDPGPATNSFIAEVASFEKGNNHLPLGTHRQSLFFGHGQHSQSDDLTNATSATADSDHSHNLPNFPFPGGQNPSSTLTTAIPTPRISLPVSDAASEYGDARKSDPQIPTVNVHGVWDAPKHDEGLSYEAAPALPEEPSQPQNQNLDVRRNTRRLTLGLRPLPPEDPSDNAEQRANRIRSFYKEYFDDSKPGRESYYEDFGPEMYQDGSYIYDQATGDYYDSIPAPFAEPVTRRAMTPPPRAPPRFQGGARHWGSGSVGGFSDRHYPGPRAFSSASNRPGAQGPRKPLPPPSPLHVLPSPHMLKDDSLMTAADYAPGVSIKDIREGRSETPVGGLRPFTPVAPARTPLASSFDDLLEMPSAHALRKSGAFDVLDFAPPPRFKNTETASDAGSIRSNRTGISTTHLHNIRTGAYRVSRLPPGAVGTKEDLMSNLRPTWDMRQA